MMTVDADNPLILNKENVSLELFSVTNNTTTVKEYLDDRNTYADTVVSKLRAVDYTEAIGNPTTKFWGPEREVNDYTLQSLNNINDSVIWTLTVPESGYYDLVLSYSTLSAGTAQRLIMVKDSSYPIILKATDDFLDLDSLRLKCNQYLEAGTVMVTLYTTGGGSTIYYWVGLIPSNQ